MKILIIGLLLFSATHCFSQGDIAEAKFHQGSNLFINGNPESALAAVNEGLRAAPQNTKLNTLKKILEQEKKKQDQQKKEQKEREQKEKEKQKQQQKDQQNKENKEKEKEKEKENKEKENKDNKENKEQNKDQQKKDEEEKQKKEQQEKKDKKDQEEKEPKDKEQQEKDNKNKDKENKELPPEVLEKLKDMKISEEKARMILDAMKNQEVQYLQQNKRQATKPKDRGKPDW